MTKNTDQHLIDQSTRWLSHLDEEQLLWADGLHSRLGNYGTTHEHIEGMLEGLGNALHDARKTLEGEDAKKRKRAASQIEHILGTLKQLALLGNITPPEEHTS